MNLQHKHINRASFAITTNETKQKEKKKIQMAITKAKNKLQAKQDAYDALDALKKKRENQSKARSARAKKRCNSSIKNNVNMSNQMNSAVMNIDKAKYELDALEHSLRLLGF